MRFFAAVLLGALLMISRAQEAIPAPASRSASVNEGVQVQRQGIAQFEFDPDEGAVVLQFLESDGAAKLNVDSASLEAIGGIGTVRAELTRSGASSFRGTLNLSEGEWNLIARVRRGDAELTGQYMLGVGKAVSSGRFALVPPNPEVGRLTNLFAWLFGVPLALGLIVTVVALVAKPGSNRAVKRV
jgi:hypothetical protein